MYYKKYISLIVLLFCFAFSHAQQLSGYVMEKNEKGKEVPLPFASIGWQKKKIAVSSGDNGHFSIPYPDSLPCNLIVSYVGYQPDTIVFTKKVDKEIKVVLK